MSVPSVTSSSNRTTTSPGGLGLIQKCAILSCAFAILVLSVNTLKAQQPDQADEVVRVDTHLVAFPIRVRDKRGQAVAGLTANDLSLKDDDNATNGLYLYEGADRVSLVFALDQSGSLREIMNQQQDAALRLFQRFSEKSQVAVIRFAARSEFALPFGRDLDATRSAFAPTTIPNQHTAIFDAAAAATKAFESLPRLRSERRLVILISDGLDTASTVKPAKVIETALKNQVTFYVIHLPLFTPRDGRLRVRTPAKGFRELAEKTGGKYFLVNATAPLVSETSADLSPVFKAIEADLKSQYLLGMYTRGAARDGRMHRVVIGLPAGLEYQIGGFGYSQKHELFVAPEPPTKE
ncbi:MAG TPA: VWA domain-containing protein [Pyrinomonadaceae bacterium]|jgi:Ca-activated chloride channel family protein|nr:VWA domain-containing protein [Pyrinomonadaceae bacterium]